MEKVFTNQQLEILIDQFYTKKEMSDLLNKILEDNFYTKKDIDSIQKTNQQQVDRMMEDLRKLQEENTYLTTELGKTKQNIKLEPGKESVKTVSDIISEYILTNYNGSTIKTSEFHDLVNKYLSSINKSQLSRQTIGNIVRELGYKAIQVSGSKNYRFVL